MSAAPSQGGLTQALAPTIMHLRLPSAQYGYYPEALGVLLAIKDENSFHETINLLHPADIFCSALEEFAQSALLLTSIVNEINTREPGENSITAEEVTKLSHLTQNLYLCSDNFLSSCRSILRCAFPTADKQCTKTLRLFDMQVRSYNDYVSKTINYIKHRHRRIRTIYCTSDNFIIAGYFVEGIVEKGVVGPDADMHNNSDCAISFNRDIPHHVANILLCAGTLGAISRDAFSVSTLIAPSSTDSNLLIRLFDECSKLQSNYFNDEIFQQRHARIKKHGKDRFVVSIDEKNKPTNRKPHLQNFKVTFRVPHMYRSIKLPYFGGR